MSEQPYFSIVIPTLNEEKYLPRLLENLTQQTFTNFEVIHVDGNSDDKTVPATSQFQGKLQLQSIVVKKRNVSYQRNVGATKARGEWIIFMDADNLLPNYFLDGVKYAIAKFNDFDVFSTWMGVDTGRTRDESIARIINAGIEVYSKVLNKPSAFGALIGVKKVVFEQVRFDENQQILEDSLYIKDIIDAGFTFRILKEPKFYFSFRRLDREGSLKMARTIAVTQLQYLQGNSFEKKNYGYTMQGGQYYEEIKPPFLQKVQDFLQTASKKQLKQAQKIIDSLTDFD